MEAARNAGPMVRQTMYLRNVRRLKLASSTINVAKYDHGSIKDNLNIHQERILAEGIEVNLDPSNVSENLKDQTADHHGKKGRSMLAFFIEKNGSEMVRMKCKGRPNVFTNQYFLILEIDAHRRPLNWN